MLLIDPYLIICPNVGPRIYLTPSYHFKWNVCETHNSETSQIIVSLDQQLAGTCVKVDWITSASTMLEEFF